MDCLRVKARAAWLPDIMRPLWVEVRLDNCRWPPWNVISGVATEARLPAPPATAEDIDVKPAAAAAA